MNGFASGILSMLLGWLRSIVNDLWRLMGSESGGSFMAFLRERWKTVFLVLCVGGFVVDRIVYFFRWRPDYVWSTKLGRLKRRLSGRRDDEEEIYAFPAYTRPQPIAPERPQQLSRQDPVSYGTTEPERLPVEDSDPATARYAPLGHTQAYPPASQSNPYSYGAAYEDDVQPVFDEATDAWAPVAASPGTYAPQTFAPMAAYEAPYEHPAQGMVPAFGAVKPDPPAYLQDVQASFAPPPAPEEALPKQPAPPQAPSQPVHPGLDLETFQQNIGLAPEGEAIAPEEPLLKPPLNFPNTTYVPFYQQADEPDGTQRRKGALSSLAKKARSLVSPMDEDDPKTIKDLQSVVNMKNAFHPPVLPKKPGEGGED